MHDVHLAYFYVQHDVDDFIIVRHYICVTVFYFGIFLYVCIIFVTFTVAGMYEAIITYDAGHINSTEKICERARVHF